MSAIIPRLKKRPEFLRVAGAGRKWVAPGLILQSRARMPEEARVDGPCAFRVGFTVSKKVGKAVVRNRVRRRLRAAVEQVMPAHAQGGHDFVVIGRAASYQRSFPGLVDDLTTALRRLKVYRNGV